MRGKVGRGQAVARVRVIEQPLGKFDPQHTPHGLVQLRHRDLPGLDQRFQLVAIAAGVHIHVHPGGKCLFGRVPAIGRRAVDHTFGDGVGIADRKAGKA